MKLSAHLVPGQTPDLIGTVRAAEAFGLARIWLFDSQLLFQDVYVWMTRGLDASERICFGPAVTNPFTRHPTATAGAIATLAQLHPGRVALGLGRGDSALRTVGREPVRTEELRELVPRLRDLIAGRAVELDGVELRIPWAAGEVPILLAATGPRNARLAGALADIAMLQVGTHPETVAWAVEHVRAGAREAGRAADDVEVSLLCAAAVDEDLERALAACRWSAASAVNHLEAALRSAVNGPFPAPAARLVEARRGGSHDYYRHMEAGDDAVWLTDELVDDFAIAGPPDRCLARLRELAALGVSEVSFLCTGRDQLERVGRELVPGLGA